MTQAAGALRMAAMRVILPVMFTREAIGNGRTVGGDTSVEFQGHPLAQRRGSRVGRH
jgi:hypothetical protein